MEYLGKVNDRSVFYTNVRKEKNWFESLPSENWVAFTIANDADAPLMNIVAERCLDKSVLYTCSTGEFGPGSELTFDLAIVNRELANPETETTTGICTVSDKNFDEGFWFAVNLAFDPYKDIDKVACIDLTSEGVRSQILVLIDKLNRGWFPPDSETEA